MAKTSKKKKKPVQALDAGTAERPAFVTNPEVKQDLQEAGRFKPTRLESTKHQRSSTRLSGEDVDAEVDEEGAEEEAVGGSVSGPGYCGEPG